MMIEDRRYDTALSQKEAALSDTTDAMAEILALFDEGTFVETGSLILRSQAPSLTAGTPADSSPDLSGVITGYGSVDGSLVFAFVQDVTRKSAALDRRHAEKIAAIYRMAEKAGAPVIGIFNSEGVDIEGGFPALEAHGILFSAVSGASGKIPQIALLLGECRELFAVTASLFDFIVCEPRARFSVGDQNNLPPVTFRAKDRFGGVTYIRDLLSYLPANAETGVTPTESADSLNRRLSDLYDAGDLSSLLSAIADNGMFLETGHETAPEIVTAFASLGGVKCGIFASSYGKNRGQLTKIGTDKLTRFIRFCDRFGIPVLSFVNSAGISEAEKDPAFSAALAEYVSAYVGARIPKISVIVGKAIGASALLFGSHSMGCDMVFSLETAEIGAMPTASAVAFAWNEKITADLPRSVLENAWYQQHASPSAVAATGGIDAIVTLPELRKRILSALFMLTAEGTLRYRRK